MPDLLGFSHIDLTVTDIERSAQWWQDVMGFALVDRNVFATHSVLSLRHPTGVVVNVMSHEAQVPGSFDERRVGLDHLSFRVSDRDEAARWATHLDSLGVPNTGVIDAPYGPTLVFRDPDNIQLEFFVHPDAATLRQLYMQRQSSESGTA